MFASFIDDFFGFVLFLLCLVSFRFCCVSFRFISFLLVLFRFLFYNHPYIIIGYQNFPIIHIELEKFGALPVLIVQQKNSLYM